MIYLDNAATSRKKPLSVKRAMLAGLKKFSANPGRGGHNASINAAQKVLETREIIKNFFNAPSLMCVVFTSGCTEALNLAILGTAQNGKHIVLTAFEHNSVLRCVNHLNNSQNVSYTIVYPNKNNTITASDIENAIKSNTYLIIVNHTSNVTGTTLNINHIGAVAKKHNLLFLVDAAQSAGHEKIDVENSNISMLAIAGHKGLLGPQGVGALVVNNVKVNPIKFGGTGTSSNSMQQPKEMPEGLESGTLATPNIIALGCGVKYVNKNFNKIKLKIYNSTSFLIRELKKIPQVKLYSHNPNSGVVSFKVNNYDTFSLANILNEKYNICIRDGLHCAPLIHKHYNTNGLIRVSLSHYNSKYHINKFIKSLKQRIK